MKFFKYWVVEKHKINIEGKMEDISLLIGSNDSKESARNEALLKAKNIERRIAQRADREDYEAGIREYISEVLDVSNVVSVCRYGAKILNTDEYTVLDLDDYAKSFWDFFKPLKGLSKKERIIHKFELFVKKHPEFGSDFRVYETAKGVRVIGKKYIDPSNKQYSRLMDKLNVDWLYLVLSRKQQCYRARLTPKPYRLGIKTIKVKTPLVCESDIYKDWCAMYEEASRRYCVAKFVKSLGKDFSRDPIVRFHDSQCNAVSNYKLA